MELNQKELELWLAGILSIGPVKTNKLLEYFKTEEEIYKAGKTALLEVEGITEKISDEIINKRKQVMIQREFEKMCEKEISLVSIHDREYPNKLKNIANPPYALFVRGRLPEENRVSIAIVGARNCSMYGKEMAFWFGKSLSNAGIQVISGLALGVDGCAHKGALSGKTSTFGILGNGIDICYPRENFGLYMSMQERGGIISEYGPGIPGRSFQFPMRNRIISGLCDGVLVVEARERSGSLITADLALEQGKEVFAIPGKIGDKLSEGCNNLVKSGAELVQSPKDILNNFHINQIFDHNKMKKNDIFLDSMEKIVYANLSLVPMHLDEILRETNLLMSDVVGVLLKLELDGFVKQTAKNYYIQSYEDGTIF